MSQSKRKYVSVTVIYVRLLVPLLQIKILPSEMSSPLIPLSLIRFLIISFLIDFVPLRIDATAFQWPRSVSASF